MVTERLHENGEQRMLSFIPRIMEFEGRVFDSRETLRQAIAPLQDDIDEHNLKTNEALGFRAERVFLEGAKCIANGVPFELEIWQRGATNKLELTV